MNTKPPIKIAHISTARSWRGGEQQLAYLLQELRSQQVQSVVLCAADSPMEAFCQKEQFTYQSFHKRSSIPLFAARQLARWVRQAGLQLVHVHDSHAHTLACLSASFFGNPCPIVVSRRVDFPVKTNVLSKWKYNHPKVQRILCVSRLILDLTQPAIKDRSKLAVVHSGIDLEKFEFQASGILRKEFNIPAELYLVANVAAIAPHKDYFTFVNTVALLVQQDFPAHFLIIGGDGGESERIRSYIQSKGLEHQITMTGFRKDIPAILPEVDVLLFTSNTEGLGTSLLDAFACGVPVVATAAGGVPELVKDESTGLLCPVKAPQALAAAVQRITSDQHLRDRLISQAKLKVEGFSKAETARKTLQHYRQILTT